MNKKVLLFLFFPTFLFGAFWNWEYISSEHFQGYYQKPNKAQAIKGLYFLEKYKGRVDSLTGFSGTGAFNLGYHFLELPKLFTAKQIKQKIPVVFQDVGEANGYANPLKPKISLYSAKIRADDFVWAQSWYRVVGVHEYTHIAQMSAREGNFLAAILGNWVSPNIYQPLWLLEGYTVYSESQIAPNEGRLNNGIFEAIAGSQKFLGETPDLQELTFYDASKFPASAKYMYGGLLMDYLSRTYGENRLASYVRGVDNQGVAGILNILFPSFYMDDVAESVFGEDFATLYQQAMDDLPAVHSDQSKELEGVKAGNILEYAVQGGVCYYTVMDYPASDIPIAKLYRWQRGKSYFLKNLTYGTDYSFQVADGKLYYRKPVQKSGFANIDQMGTGIRKELYCLDLQRNKEERVIADDIQSFAVDTGANIYYSLENPDTYGSQLYHKKGDERPKLLLTSDKYISQMARDSREFVFTAKTELGSLGLYRWSDEQGEMTSMLNSVWTEADAQLEAGKMCYTANYDGTLAGYRCDMHSMQVTKLITAEFAQSVSIDRGLVYYLGLGKDGYRLCCDTLQSEEFAPPANEKEKQFAMEDWQYTAEGNAVLRNLASILIPDIRLSPLLQQGADILGTTEYLFSYGEQFSLSALTTIFDPFIFSVSYQSDDFLLQSYLPIYSSVDFGLSSAYIVGGYTDEETQVNNTQHRQQEWFTGIKLVFQLPYDYLDITATCDDEDDIASAINYSHYFSTAKIVLQAETDKIASESLSWEEREKKASLYYMQRFWKINKGLWSPSIFWRDLAIKLFAEYDREELSTLSDEQSTSFGVGVVPRVLTLLGNLSSELEMGARWEKDEVQSDYQPEFYTKLVFNF